MVEDLETLFFTLRNHVPACERLIEDGSMAFGEDLLRVRLRLIRFRILPDHLDQTFVDDVAAQHRVCSIHCSLHSPVLPHNAFLASQRCTTWLLESGFDVRLRFRLAFIGFVQLFP